MAPLSPSPMKRRWRIARGSLLLIAVGLILLLPNISYSYSPPALPSGSGSILSSSKDRRGRGQGSTGSFSKEKEMKDRATFLSSGSSLLSFPLSHPFSFSLSYSPTTPSPLRMDMCIVAWPNGLIVVFVPTVCPPECLLWCVRCLLFRCVVHRTTYDDFPPALPRG